MRDRFEIVHMLDGGSYQTLVRSIPKKRRDRWIETERFARLCLRGRIVKDLQAVDDYGLTYAYGSVDHPEDGYVGIREKD